MNSIFNIGNVEIGDERPCFLVAEIGLNHNGSMVLARRLIEVAALSGAAMVKFQKRNIDELAVSAFLDAPFPKCPSFGRTQREVRTRLEFDGDQMLELADYARQWGLLFSMSVFDVASLQIAVRMMLPVIKLASHSITNGPLLEAVAATKSPVILSLGASTWEERDKAVALLSNSPLCLLHCVSAYPCPDTCVKLDTLAEIKTRYGRVVGYSGHETGIELSLAAAALGAAVIERHFTLTRSMMGLDHGASLEPAEFAELARQVRRLDKARGTVSGILPEEMASRQNYHGALRVKESVRKGMVIRRELLVCKQPLGPPGEYFTGLEMDVVLGRSLAVDLAAEAAIPRTALLA